MASSINNFFVKADNVCDYIPGISFLSNITDLFQKSVVLPCMSQQSIKDNRYYTHLKDKSISRCIILLFPVIGNIIFGIYDFANRKYNDRDFMLSAVKKNGCALRYASYELKNDRELVLAAVQEDVWAEEKSPAAYGDNHGW